MCVQARVTLQWWQWKRSCIHGLWVLICPSERDNLDPVALVLLYKETFWTFTSECARRSQDGGPAGAWRSGLVSAAKKGGEATGEGHPTGGVRGRLHRLRHWWVRKTSWNLRYKKPFSASTLCKLFCCCRFCRWGPDVHVWVRLLWLHWSGGWARHGDFGASAFGVFWGAAGPSGFMWRQPCSGPDSEWGHLLLGLRRVWYIGLLC